MGSKIKETVCKADTWIEDVVGFQICEPIGNTIEP